MDKMFWKNAAQELIRESWLVFVKTYGTMYMQ